MTNMQIQMAVVLQKRGRPKGGSADLTKVEDGREIAR